MSYPYPQDRTRDKQTKGEEPYEEAREAFGENEAEIERTASRHADRASRRIDEDQERDAEARFDQIGEDVATEHEQGGGS